MYYLINRVFKLLKYFIETKKIFYVVKLENLHLQSVKTLKNLSKILEIDYQDSLLISSYHKKNWWGDQLSKKYLDGLNPNFKNNIDYNYFFRKDLALINYYLRDIFENYNYEKIQTRKYYLLPLLKFLPLKIELIFLKTQIKSLNFKNIILFFFYWLKRIRIMKNDLYKNLNLPKDITNF